MKNNRAIFIFILIILAFIILIGRTGYLQIFKWREKSLEVQDLSTKMITLSAKRGNIYGVNGELLAWNERQYQIINLGQIIEKDIEVKIRDVLYRSDVNIEDVIDKLNFQRRINISINPATARQLNNLDNIMVVERYVRKYAHESLYHVLGYVDTEGNPRSGLELVWDDILRGDNGFRIITRTPSGRQKSIVSESPAINGNNIYTTIDLEMQIYIYEELKKSNHLGSVILSNPKTGDIIALVSYPSPNPNAFSRGLTNLEFRRILNDASKPLINRAISATYPPGSVFKPFVSYSALEYGVNPEDTVISTGRYSLRNSAGNVIATFSDWYTLGHGETDFIKSLRVSANTYYYDLAEKMGISFLSEKASEYKISERTDIEIPGERAGVFGDEDWKKENLGEQWYPGETLLSFIGQGYVESTPIQMLRYYNILATKGEYYRFNLFKNSQDLFGNIIEEKLPYLQDRYEMNQEFLSYIYQGLYEVTTYSGGSADGGTAYESFLNYPINVAGKTGTAEVSGGRKSHAWFAGFLPIEDPEISIIVFVEHGGYGTTIAAPLARKVLDFFVR
jgi:penicillin-binding protein 2